MTNVACRTGVIFVVFLLTSEQSIIECLASDALTQLTQFLSVKPASDRYRNQWMLKLVVGPPGGGTTSCPHLSPIS